MKGPANVQEIKDAIIQAMAMEDLSITDDSFRCKNRARPNAMARQMFSFILWHHYGWGPTAIAAEVNKNHASVIYSYATACALIETLGTMGRTYLCVCGIIGITPDKMLIPRISQARDYDIDGSLVAVKPKSEPLKKIVNTRKKEDESEFVKPMMWTEKEKLLFKKNATYPGVALDHNGSLAKIESLEMNGTKHLMTRTFAKNMKSVRDPILSEDDKRTRRRKLSAAKYMRRKERKLLEKE